MTEVGTPRNETLIVQTFDGKTNAPDNMNPLSGGYALWRGFRELAWGYLWEMDTATGQSYPELAADLPKVLNEEYTQFEIPLKKGVYWSDGTEFTADDVIYTLDTYFNNKDKLTYWGVSSITNYVKSYEKVDDYTVRVETVKPAYDFATTLGVYTWGSAFNIVPKHIFEKQERPRRLQERVPGDAGRLHAQVLRPQRPVASVGAPRGLAALGDGALGRAGRQVRLLQELWRRADPHVGLHQERVRRRYLHEPRQHRRRRRRRTRTFTRLPRPCRTTTWAMPAPTASS